MPPAAVARNDPIEQRRGQRDGARLTAARRMTFDECAAAYINGHEAGWRNAKHRAQWVSTLATYVSPVLGSLPVQAIEVALVLRVLEPIWTTKPETAGRVRGRIEAILDWSTARGHRVGENPARWRGHLAKLLPARSKVRRVKHHAALPFDEIPQFMAALRSQEGVGALALEFSILTIARTSETTGATWNEINAADKIWIVPPDRMKAEKEHRVPLSGARSKSLRRSGQYVTRMKPTSFLADTTASRLATWQCSSCSSAWVMRVLRCTDSGRHSAIGLPSAQISQTKLSRWRSRTALATRPRLPTAGATCF